MAKVLVTGGAGYVGSHACKALRAAGHDPVVFDNFATGWRDAVRFGEYVEGDLLTKADLANAFENHRPDAVMHFAAFSNVGESMAQPDLYWRNNVTGSLNLLEAARGAGVSSVVFSSTCATYGEANGASLSEDDAQLPVNTYGRTKLAVEHLLHDFHAAFGTRSVIFRYFNAAGADPDRRIGEDHRPETHLIPLVLDAASGRRERISIFGTDYPTPDGTCIRDYIHVDDLASAHVLGLEWLLDGGKPIALNLGSGSGYSVREVIDTARRVTGTAIPEEAVGRRPGDPPQLVSGSALAHEILGWEPKRSDLATMIDDAWGWHQMPRYAR
ncbi:MAG: UDP-glucose 4-epimerase GalE [Pseudomonadota bacterium]